MPVGGAVWVGAGCGVGVSPDPGVEGVRPGEDGVSVGVGEVDPGVPVGGAVWVGVGCGVGVSVAVDVGAGVSIGVGMGVGVGSLEHPATRMARRIKLLTSQFSAPSRTGILRLQVRVIAPSPNVV